MTVKIWMVFEAVGADKETVRDSMKDHIETLGNDEGIEITEKEEDETIEMENPHPSLEKGFSKVVEVRAEFESFPKAIESVINYGPTYVQFEGPDTYELELKEAQNTLQSVADTMHKYAQMGAGGVIVSRHEDETS